MIRNNSEQESKGPMYLWITRIMGSKQYYWTQITGSREQEGTRMNRNEQEWTKVFFIINTEQWARMLNKNRTKILPQRDFQKL